MFLFYIFCNKFFIAFLHSSQYNNAIIMLLLTAVKRKALGLSCPIPVQCSFSYLDHNITPPQFYIDRKTFSFRRVQFDLTTAISTSHTDS